MSNPILDSSESLSGRFMATALLFPERNALYADDRYYSYKELSERVHGISNELKGYDVKRVAIYCEATVETYATILALNFIGAVYIPLNPKFPDTRNQRIIAEAKPDLIISGNKRLTGPSPKTDSNGLCYILFTSGSTGEPKGVPVSNENVRHFFNFFLKEYDFNENDRFLQCYELTFDVSVFSFFMPLLVGGCCYVLPAGGIKPFRIADQLKKKEITVVSMVPSVINYLQKYLSEIQLPHLRYSFFSGDALLFDVAGEWSKCLSNGKIHNFYGPTETTIVCTRFIIGGEKGVERTANNIVPLGKPFPGMEILITDENNKPVNKGELCFSGSQVIAGYLDGKNEEQFFEYKGKRFYKTGDIVSIEGDDLLFLGRKDDQVKINGYRVELGEIKVVLERITRVRAEVIFDKGILIAFVEQKDQSEKGIKEALLKVLPEYMVPHQVIFVQELPLNLNGKVDKKQLLNMQL